MAANAILVCLLAYTIARAAEIGRRKFIYDLWGDAVNTASRMESHGTGGKIQSTEATYDLIKDEFVCEPRGTIQVKGKGPMPVWHVLGAEAEHVAVIQEPVRRTAASNGDQPGTS